MKSLTPYYVSKLSFEAEDLLTLAKIGIYRSKQELCAEQAPEMLEALRRNVVIASSKSSNRIEQVVAPRERIQGIVEHRVRRENRPRNTFGNAIALYVKVFQETIASVRVRFPYLTFALLVTAATTNSVDAFAQQSDPHLSGDESRPTVGLVLSGGSAKGIAHIGVIKVLEAEGIPVDVVTGTSMGSIVGGLYAAGYSAAQLEEIVTSQDWGLLFSDRALRRNKRLEQRVMGEGVLISLPVQGMSPKLPSGLLAGQEILALFTRLTWPYHDIERLDEMPIPFTAVATNLRTGAAQPLIDVPLPLAMRTSMSLPSIFAPVEIDGELYIDGGLARNIPAEDAIRLGADVLIGVDVGETMDSTASINKSLVDVLLEASWFQALKSDARQRTFIDLLIRPDIEGIPSTAFDEAASWIERGEEAARAALPELRALADSLGLRRTVADTITAPGRQPLEISLVEIAGVRGEAAGLVRGRLGLAVPGLYLPDEIDGAIRKVYGTGLFDLVTYRLLPDHKGAYILRVDAKPQRVPDRIGLGFRYDSYYKAELLFSLALKHRLRFGSTAEIRARLGEQGLLEGRLFSRLGALSRVMAGGALGYAGAPLRLFLPRPYAIAVGMNPDVPVFGLRLDVLSAELVGGYMFTESAMAGVRLKAQHVHSTEEVTGLTLAPSTESGHREPDDQIIITGGAFLKADSFDRLDFPTRGIRFNAEAKMGLSDAESLLADAIERPGRGFRHALATLRVLVSIHPRVSLLGRGAFAYGSGDALPITYYNFLGGVHTTTVLSGGFLPLYGLATQARIGRKAYVGMVGAQWEARPDLFIRVLGNIGDTYDLLYDNEKTVLPEEVFELIHTNPAIGFGMELGLRTPLGPVAVTASGARFDELPSLSLNVGYTF